MRESAEAPCGCCPDCTTGKPAGTMGQCGGEDTCVEIVPEPYFAVLARDPNRAGALGGLWYPERPANFPAAELADLGAAIASHLPPAALTALAAALAPYLAARVPPLPPPPPPLPPPVSPI